MGEDAGIIAKIGKDDFGKLSKNRLLNDGVNIDLIFSIDGYTTGTAFVTYFDAGNREFIYHFTHSAAGQLCPADIKDEHFEGVEYLHIMGCSLLASKSMRKAILKAVNICKERGIIISFDPNIRPELLAEKDIFQAFNEILEKSSILLTGLKELSRIYRYKDLQGFIADLIGEQLKTLVLKKGAEGIEVYDAVEGYQSIKPYQVQEIDPTGAGDCFDGAFIASLSGGKNVMEAAQIANAAAALSVTKKGPMEGVADKYKILQMLD